MPQSRLALLGLALAGGFLIVVIANGAIELGRGNPIAPGPAFGSVDALDVGLMQLLLASLPMVLLAVKGSRRRALWWLAILLMGGFWAYFVFQTWLDSLRSFEGGANIGLGLLMLVAPFLVVVAVVVAGLALRAAPPADR